MESPENYSIQEDQAQEENTMSEARMQELGASILEDSVARTENDSPESFEPVSDKLPGSESGVQETSVETPEVLGRMIEVEDQEKIEKIRRDLNREESDSLPPRAPRDDYDGDRDWDGRRGPENFGNQGNSRVEYHTTINNIYTAERKIRFKTCERCLGTGRRWTNIPLIPCTVCHGKGKVSDLGLL